MSTEEIVEMEDFENETEELEASEEMDSPVELGEDMDDEVLETEGMELASEISSEDDEAVDFSEAAQLDFSDVEDDVECPFELDLRKRVVEAVLFVSDKPVGLSTLVAAFGEEENMRKAHVKEALEALEEDLKETDRGFRLHLVDGGYQLRTAEDLKEFLQNTIKARSFRLTGPSLETLAMVAYKQPCTKSQIDEIRGVESSHLVRALMDRNLLAFAGKSELPGKPMLYKTTSKFLEVFGLRNIKELPSLAEIEALLPNGIGDEEEEEKETLAELAGKLEESYDGSYSASEEELGKINDQLSSISTETEFFEQEKQREKDRKELEKAENLREALMVGEEISTRDQNWLVRFDEKMKALEENAEAEEVAVEEEGGETSVSEGLEALSEETEAVEALTSDVEEEMELAADEEVLEVETPVEEVMSEEDIAEAAAAKLIADSMMEDSEVVEAEEGSLNEDFDEGFEDAAPEMDI